MLYNVKRFGAPGNRTPLKILATLALLKKIVMDVTRNLERKMVMARLNKLKIIYFNTFSASDIDFLHLSLKSKS